MNAKHQAAVAATSDRVADLRVEIHTQLDVIVGLAGQLDDLADTHQRVGLPIQTPDALAARAKTDAIDRAAARLGTGVAPGKHPAPVTIPAVSASAEILFTLQHHVRRLGRSALEAASTRERNAIDDAGTCPWPRALVLVRPPFSDGTAQQLATHLGNLVDLWTSRPGLEALRRELDHLEDVALTVIDGVPTKEAAPRPTCPWCGRDSLVLIHREKRRTQGNGDTGYQPVEVIRCVGTHPCVCSHDTCPCHRGRRRHEWHRAAGATDTWTQLANLQNKHQELTHMETLALDARDRALKLHHEIPIHPWADECPTPDEHGPRFTEADHDSGLICIACDPVTTVCAECVELTADDYSTWPCPTAQALTLETQE